MVDGILPQRLKNLIEPFSERLEEIRLRRNAPVILRLGGKNIYLKYGSGEKVFASGQDIDEVLRRATENSLYAFNSQIKQGFITARGGIRVGIAGESVNSDNFMPTTIKNVTSLHIRIPHEVIDCSKNVFKFIASENEIKNTLIISPPGAGKTTLIRDIARKISELKNIYNCLMVDERFELASCVGGETMLDVGANTDVISGASKKYAFSFGIRSLKPDVILTDELMTKDDADACINAMRSGVKVIASIHAKNHLEIIDKQDFSNLIKGKFFERIVVLSNKNGVGSVDGIFDENLKCLYF